MYKVKDLGLEFLGIEDENVESDVFEPMHEDFCENEVDLDSLPEEARELIESLIDSNEALMGLVEDFGIEDFIENETPEEEVLEERTIKVRKSMSADAVKDRKKKKKYYKRNKHKIKRSQTKYRKKPAFKQAKKKRERASYKHKKFLNK